MMQLNILYINYVNVEVFYFLFSGSTFFEIKKNTMHATAHTAVSIYRPV